MLAITFSRSSGAIPRAIPGCFIRSIFPCRVRSVSNAVIRDGDPESKAIWDAAKPFNTMPGPKSYPIIGSLLDVIMNDDQKEFKPEKRFMFTVFDRFGPIVRLDNPTYFSGTNVITHDLQIFKLLLRNESKYPSRSLAMDDLMSFIHKKADIPMFMFFAIGDEWKKLRTAMAKPMLPRKVAMLTSPLYDAANRLGDHWLEKRDENGTVDDIRSDLQKWALNGVGWFIFNTNIDVFNPNDKISNEFTKASVKFVESFIHLLMRPPVIRSLPSKTYRDYVNAIRNMHSIGSRIMQSRFEELEDLVNKGEDYLDEHRISVIEYMLIDGRITKREALSQACDLLAAGVDTTSSTASFLLYLISQRPDIQKDLFDEINRVCGDKEFPDFNDLQSMSLVRNCVKETLRMYPTVPTIFRNIENDMVLHGYQVHKNTSLLYSPLVATKSFYGPDFYKFDPYRWRDNKNEEEQEIMKFANIPFGFGVRMCYGRRLAELELHLLLVNMIKRFTLSSDQPSVRTQLMSLYKIDEPVRLQIKPR